MSIQYTNPSIDIEKMIINLTQMQMNVHMYANELDAIIENKSFTSGNIPIPTINHNINNVLDKSREGDDNKTIDIANDDTYQLIIQQNTMYIFGSLACASLLIASIFIGKQ
jgi:hypothetical protein